MNDRHHPPFPHGATADDSHGQGERRDERIQSCPAPPDLERFTLESACEGFWAWSPPTGDVYFSPRCQELIGATVDELRGTAELWRSLGDPSDLERARATILDAASRSGGTFLLELRLVRQRDGQGRWFSVRGRAVDHDASGAPMRILGTLEDITEARDVQEELRRSEERYRSLVEQQGEGIGRVDADERFTFANPAAERIFGVGRGELVGRTLHEFLDDEGRARVLDQTRRRRGGTVDSYELTIVRPDGERRTLLVTASPGVGEPGEYGGAYGIFRDITERTLAEKAVRESEARYRRLIESLPHGVGIVTSDRVAFVNRAALKTLGYERLEDVVGVHPLSLVVEGEHDHVGERLGDLIRGVAEEVSHFFTRCRHRGGTEIPVEVFATVVVYAGHPAIQLFLMDLTERQQSERRQAHLEEQLRQAHKMESIGRLAGGIAHDFNNALAPILGLAEIARSDAPPDSERSRDLQTIIESAERARDLTSQLLAFGRKQLLQMRAIDLNEVARNAHDLLRRLFRESVTIRLEIDPRPSIVRADESQLQQVLMNLAINAHDAMPEGGQVTIMTSCVELDEARARELAELGPGPHALLSVRDEGRGMDAEALSHTFEPFIATEGRTSGVGWGLATVHGIVKQHGGHITVESAVGAGTTFTVYLPQFAAAAEALGAARAVRRTRGDATILVVEDDAAVRRAACRILGSEGFRLIEARDGEEALVLARRHEGPIDVVLTDVIMPRLNGLELAQRIAVVRPDSSVIFMSGYASDIITDPGVLAGEALFIQKPFTVRSLLEKIDLALATVRRFSSAPA
jgi:PAS domain S-box-containing protein